MYAKLIAACITGATAFVLTLVHPGAPSAHRIGVAAPTQPHLSSATVSSVVTGGRSTMVVLRLGKDRVTTLPGAKLSPLLSRDDHPLSLADLRPGDRLVQTAGRTTDISQRSVHFTGIVSSASDPQGRFLIVAVGSQGIVLDMNAHTSIVEPGHGKTAPSDVVDGDIIDVYGVLDGPLSEMTRTYLLKRVGP